MSQVTIRLTDNETTGNVDIRMEFDPPLEQHGNREYTEAQDLAFDMLAAVTHDSDLGDAVVTDADGEKYTL